MLFSGLFTGIFLELHAQVGIRPEKAESGGGKLLGKGHLALSRQLWGLGSAVSSPSGVWGGAPAEIEFGAF